MSIFYYFSFNYPAHKEDQQYNNVNTISKKRNKPQIRKIHFLQNGTENAACFGVNCIIKVDCTNYGTGSSHR